MGRVPHTLLDFSARSILAQTNLNLMMFTDKTGKRLEGGGIDQLSVPAGVPVTRYWSGTVYDRDTQALVRNMQRESRLFDETGKLLDAKRIYGVG